MPDLARRPRDTETSAPPVESSSTAPSDSQSRYGNAFLCQLESAGLARDGAVTCETESELLIDQYLMGAEPSLVARHGTVVASDDPSASRLFPPIEQVFATPYTERTAAIETLGAEYPGVDLDDEEQADSLDKLGVWSGALLQTEWQQSSGRGDSVWWSTMNYSLTIVPRLVEQEYAGRRAQILSRGGTPQLLDTSAIVEPTEDDVRRVWMDYYEIADRHRLGQDDSTVILGVRFGGSLPSAQEAYWVAHVLSLKCAEAKYRADLEANPLPDTERDFRAAWWEMVDKFDEIGMPTTGGFSETMLTAFMPEHMLATDDSIDELPFMQEAFAQTLVTGTRAARGLGEAYDWTAETAGEAYDWTAQSGGEAYDWAAAEGEEIVDFWTKAFQR